MNHYKHGDITTYPNEYLRDLIKQHLRKIANSHRLINTYQAELDKRAPPTCRDCDYCDWNPIDNDGDQYEYECKCLDEEKAGLIDPDTECTGCNSFIKRKF